MIYTSNIIAQSNKEIIQILNTRIDSLNLEVKKRDVQYEQEVIANSNHKETLSSQIRKQDNDIRSGKIAIDSLQNINVQLIENNLNLHRELGILKDSITFLYSKLSSASNNETDDVVKGLSKVKFKWDYFMGEFADVKYIFKDSLNKICNDERCVSFLMTSGFLVVTYRIIDVVEFDTQIIDLNSNIDLLSTSQSKIYVEDFDKENNTLIISSEGYDGNGRYWQFGTWNFNEKTVILGEKEY